MKKKAIAQNPTMREQVIASITKRIVVLTSELRMWELSIEEQQVLFARMRQELSR